MDLLFRFGAFLSVFLAMSVWELLRPRRRLAQTRRERWSTNLGLTALDSFLVWITVGGVSYATAQAAAEQGMGLLPWLDFPGWAAAIVTLLVLDFTVYVQHILFHAVPLLWRLHRVHHADLDLDATTGLRFHPIEIFLSLGLKAAVIVLLGATPWAVVAFEALLNASSVFNHSNVAIPTRRDRWLRRRPSDEVSSVTFSPLFLATTTTAARSSPASGVTRSAGRSSRARRTHPGGVRIGTHCRGYAGAGG